MLFDRTIQPQWLALQSFVLVNWSLQEKAGRFPPYLEKTLNNVEYTLRVMCLTLGLTRKQMIVEPAFKIIWHNDIFHQ